MCIRDSHCCPYVNRTVLRPVSYTHLDVYKRQWLYIKQFLNQYGPTVFNFGVPPVRAIGCIDYIIVLSIQNSSTHRGFSPTIIYNDT